MKSITEIKALMANKNLLTPNQMVNVKGGTDTSTSATTDDKRRERPGGGVSTQ